MTIPRRTFLLQAVAGLAAAGCDRETPVQETSPAPPPPKPQALIDALAQMRAENKPGIALRIPTDKQQRHSPGHLLVYHLNQDRPEGRQMFSEVVFVCLESPVIESHLPGAEPHHDLVLFNEEGRAEGGHLFNYNESRQRLPEVVATLAHGSDGARLKERAQAIREKTVPAVLAALDRLAGEADKTLLLQEARRIMPLLVQSRREATAPARQLALRELLDAACASSRSNLPYGIGTGPFEGGCGDDPCVEQAPRDPDYNIVIACGMARATPGSRSFLRYLTR